MKQEEIANILTSAHYKVIPIEPFASFVALAPNERMTLFYVVTEQEHIDDVIQKSIYQLCATRSELTKIISDTLDDIKLYISMAIVYEGDIMINNKTEQLLFMNNVQFIKYMGTKKSIYAYYPRIRISQEDAGTFDAFHNYIVTTVSFMGKVSEGRFEVNQKEDHIKKQKKRLYKSNQKYFSSPRALAAEVKKYVKGQDKAIDSISIPFFQHIESMKGRTNCDVKESFILAGGTGTGKSEILRRFCEITGVPFIRINTADCNPNSWRGQHISDYIGYMITDKADIDWLRYAVLFFDEFDKITHRNQRLVGDNSSDWDADMQREFLRFYDKGYELVIEKQSSYGLMEKYHFPVDNLLICYAGAYSGIEDIIDKRLNKRPKIGYTTPLQVEVGGNGVSEIQVNDLEEWGYMPELLGRIGSFITLNPMSEDLIFTILTTASENILDAHTAQCAKYGINLQFAPEALRYIAHQAVKSELGFRAVKPILAKMMKNVYFDCDKYAGTTLLVDLRYIRDSELKRCKQYS